MWIRHPALETELLSLTFILTLVYQQHEGFTVFKASSLFVKSFFASLHGTTHFWMRLGCYMPSKASMSESKPEFILKIFLRTFCDARVKLQLANLHVKLTLLSWCGSQTDISIIFGSSCFSI